MVVAEAATAEQRAQGLQGLDRLPPGVEGVLFTYPVSVDAIFHMRTVGFDLDIWWFDAAGVLVGSTVMEECLDGGCVSYESPKPVMWALETTAGEFDFPIGAVLSVP